MFFNKLIKAPVKYIQDINPISVIFRSDIKKEKKENFLSEFFQKNLPLKQEGTDIDLKILSDMQYIPGLDLILQNQAIFLPEMFDLTQGRLTPELLFLNIKSRRKNFFFQRQKDQQSIILSKEYYKVSKIIKEGINLLHSINNYWHFLIEEAPKIILAQDFKISPTIPLLIPDSLHPNLYEVMNILNQGKYKREVIKLPVDINNPNKGIKVKKTYHISPHLNLHMHPFEEDLLNGKPFDLIINQYPIKELVRRVFLHYKIDSYPDKSVKLFLKRSSSYRIAKDQEKLEAFLVKKGFQVFDPEILTLEEQVKICSQASIFVGFSGAGYTNALFAPTEAKKILFSNTTFFQLVSFWNHVLENFYALDNGFNELEFDRIHGIPYLTEKNWKNLEKILQNLK